MARSVVKSTVAVSGDTWHNSSVNRGWQWKGDTSSDEVRDTSTGSHDQPEWPCDLRLSVTCLLILLSTNYWPSPVLREHLLDKSSITL